VVAGTSLPTSAATTLALITWGAGPSLVVAAATLAVAVVFQPLRRRVQAAVDRRFNRRRHDAARSIGAFSARLRDQVDLITLTGELLAVVDQTMQPTRASLWLRPQGAAAPSDQTATSLHRQGWPPVWSDLSTQRRHRGVSR
jgi:hypothetical protein